MTTVGFLGCAHVHADTYAARLPAAGGTPVAVYDHNPSRAATFAGNARLRTVGSVEELCDGVDAVIVAAEHVEFPELVVAATANGVPVLCEKPLGTSLEAARQLSGAGGWVSMALPVRYAHPVRQAKALIEEGGLGGLVAMSGVNHASFPGGFFGSRAQAGGGALIDHVVHLADTTRWLTGCDFQTVYAIAANVRNEGDVEDTAQVIAVTTDGAWVSIDPSWSRPAGMAGDVDLLMTLWFERGQIKVDAFARRVSLTMKGGAHGYRSYGVDMVEAMLTDWLGAIRDGAPPPVPVADGWRATQVALGALRSAETGQVVDLEAPEWRL